MSLASDIASGIFRAILGPIGAIVGGVSLAWWAHDQIGGSLSAAVGAAWALFYSFVASVYVYVNDQFPELALWASYLGKVSTAFNQILVVTKWAGTYFPISTWVTLFVVALFAKMSIRAVRWVLSLIPFINAG